MPKKYRVELSEEEREELRGLLRRGKGGAKTLQRARILLKADQSAGGPGWRDEDIAEAFDVSHRSIERLRERCVEEGLEKCLQTRPSKRVYSRRLDGKAEAHLVALACGKPPQGRQRWSVRLLADKLVELEVVEEVHATTVHRVLKKMNLSLG